MKLELGSAQRGPNIEVAYGIHGGRYYRRTWDSFYRSVVWAVASSAFPEAESWAQCPEPDPQPYYRDSGPWFGGAS